MSIFKLHRNTAPSGADSTEALFRQLLATYQQPLYWHIRHIVDNHEDAEDALQECFVRAYRNIQSLRDASSERAWLYRIATNEALRLVEGRKTTLEYSDEVAAPASTQAAPLSVVHNVAEADTPDYDALQQALEQAIAQLPARQRAVFCMRYYDDLSYEEIAENLSSNVKAVTANYHVAKEKIRQYLLAL